jgi:hypothetical protein
MIAGFQQVESAQRKQAEATSDLADRFKGLGAAGAMLKTALDEVGRAMDIEDKARILKNVITDLETLSANFAKSAQGSGDAASSMNSSPPPPRTWRRQNCKLWESLQGESSTV